MHGVLTRGRPCNPDHQNPTFFSVKLDNDTDLLVTIGRLLLDAPYSVALRSIIFQCLACDWNKRPDARKLLGVIELGIAALEAIRESEDSKEEESATQDDIIIKDGEQRPRGILKYPEPEVDPKPPRKKARRRYNTI